MAEEPNPFIRGGSIGVESNKDKSCPKKDGFRYRPIKCWQGEKFIFLPRSKSSQKFEYQGFECIVGGEKYYDDTYDKLVGRIGTVLDVTSERVGWKVTIRMDDNGHCTPSASGDDPEYATIKDIAPLLDLQVARDKWLGKTLWLKSPYLSTYDEATDKFRTLNISSASQVTVTDVVAGWYNDKPIRFIVQTDSGAEGYEDFRMSGTNGGSPPWPPKPEEKFFEHDPRQIFNWSDRVWNAIAYQDVFVGMKKEQAQLSWGKPKDINRTLNSRVIKEQWVYGSGSYLYFEDGLLVAIQY